MAQFPRAESELIALAERMVTGLANNSEVFSNPIINLEEFAVNLNNSKAAIDTTIATRAAAEQATDAKNKAMALLTDQMKALLRYAEAVTQFDDSKLKLIGWGGRSTGKTPDVPEAVRDLEASRQGPNWIFLSWKRSTYGRRPTAYKVQLFDRNANLWKDIATVLDSEAILFDQEPGKKLEYRVIATNKVGDSSPSNSISVVL